MQLSYDLDTTTIEATQPELDDNRTTINRAKRSEKKRGRTVTVLVKLDIHEATEKQVEFAPLGRLFPRPVQSMGAIVPILIADKLREYVRAREQPLSDLSRILWTEFLIANDRIKRGQADRGDSWAKFIEKRLNDVLELRQSKKKISYARTKQLRLKTKAASNRLGRPKGSKVKTTKKAKAKMTKGAKAKAPKKAKTTKGKA